MKVIDWLKNVLLRTRKKDYMLNEKNINMYKEENKTEFIPKVDVSKIKNKKSRENILISIREDIMEKDLSEYYNYQKFSYDNIRNKYDIDCILSDEDITALSCIHGAILNGNMNELKFSDNKINIFLSENPNNIIVLVNLMIKDAKSIYEGLDHDELPIKTSIQGLIAGSYEEISDIIKKYKEEREVTID